MIAMKMMIALTAMMIVSRCWIDLCGRFGAKLGDELGLIRRSDYMFSMFRGSFFDPPRKVSVIAPTI